MGEHEQLPIETDVNDPLPTAQTDESTSTRPSGNWEGYSLEILSIWFDP